MKYFITYSDGNFKKNRNFSVFMAKLFGGFDRVIGYKPTDIDADFYNSYKHILSQKKGGGFWLWKPYFILKTLKEMNAGDFLFYADAGSFMLKNINLLVEELRKSNQDIIGFELPLIESQWTKKELFIKMNCIGEEFKNTNQLMASFQLIRKTDFSIVFYKELLEYACDEKNITDVFDYKIAQEKYFIDHRHDQSIFSLLYKKYNLKPFKDPSQYGRYPNNYAGMKIGNLKVNKLHVLKNGRKFRYFHYGEHYNLIVFHYRRESPIVKYIKYKIKEILYLFGLK
jgi:hypothetical protein